MVGLGWVRLATSDANIPNTTKTIYFANYIFINILHTYLASNFDLYQIDVAARSLSSMPFPI